jgi:hypothetical protein
MSTEVFGFGFDCVPSFSSGEVVSKRARVQSRSSGCEPKGNLDGFLARLQDLLRKTKARRAGNGRDSAGV